MIAATFHGPLFETVADDGLEDLEAGFRSLTNHDEWVAYALRHLRWTQELIVELDLPLRLWPDQTLET